MESKRVFLIFVFLQGVIEDESFVNSRRKSLVFLNIFSIFRQILKIVNFVNNNVIGFTFRDRRGLSTDFVSFA